MIVSRHLEEKISKMQPLIIIGMHRSGTSLMVHLLDELGIHLGNNLSRDAESIYFQKINRKIYKAADNNWGNVDMLLESMNDEEFISDQSKIVRNILFPTRNTISLNRGICDYFGRKVWVALNQDQMVWWGWKDPRTTLTFPIWLRIFPNARVLHVIRNGIDVAISTHRRTKKQRRKFWKNVIRLDFIPQTLDFNYCFQLWEKYVSFVMTNKRLIPSGHYFELRYEQLLSDSKETLRMVLNYIEYPIHISTIEDVCRQINTDRLNNVDFARPYQQEISLLAQSEVMEKLGYSYKLN